LCLSRTGERGADTPSGCVASSILAIFGYERANWATEQLILSRINNESAWDRTTVGPGFVLTSVAGRIQREGDQITGARALGGSFIMAGNVTLEDSNDGDTSMQGWEEEWLDFMEVRSQLTYWLHDDFLAHFCPYWHKFCLGLHSNLLCTIDMLRTIASISRHVHQYLFVA
jgi:hypothetical protein